MPFYGRGRGAGGKFALAKTGRGLRMSGADSGASAKAGECEDSEELAEVARLGYTESEKQVTQIKILSL